MAVRAEELMSGAGLQPAGPGRQVANLPHARAWLPALALALILTAGCTTLDPFVASGDGPPGGAVYQVVATWRNEVIFAPDPTHAGAPTPGLAGRMYLFGPQIDFPVQGDGGVVARHAQAPRRWERRDVSTCPVDRWARQRAPTGGPPDPPSGPSSHAGGASHVRELAGGGKVSAHNSAPYRARCVTYASEVPMKKRISFRRVHIVWALHTAAVASACSSGTSLLSGLSKCSFVVLKSVCGKARLKFSATATALMS